MSDLLAFKVTTVANSEGVILPREARDRLDVKKGDTVFPTEAPDGSYRLTPYSRISSGRWRLPKRSCMKIGISFAHWRSD